MDEYDHILFDDNKIRYTGNTNQQLILNDECSFEYTGKENEIIIESYAFSVERDVIAIHYFIIGDSNNQILYPFRINGMDITKEIFSLLLLPERREILFDTYNSLYEYCDKNNIALSSRYHCAAFGSKPETIQEIYDGYSIVSFPYEYKSIRLYNDDIYFGQIKDIEINENEFHFKLIIPAKLQYPYSMNCNSGLNLKDAKSFNKWQVWFNKDNLYSGVITINRS